MQPGTDPYGTRLDAAIAVRGEAIAWIGASVDAARIAAQDGVPVHDASGRWITPGLIDCHTHLVYGGNRVAEFERRLRGESYEDIARTGGGIQSTVRATRAASHGELYAGAARRAARLMAEGVTTIEIKSGYGLDGATERRLLEVARSLGRELPVSIRTTYLGLHALPEEFAADRRAYVEAASGPWLDAIVGAGLADAADAFCDSIGFTVGETEGYLGAARRAGLAVRVHAGQLCDIGAAELAARCGALSADHLEYLSVAGVSALAEAGTVAVLLPCAYFMLHQQDPPPVAALRQAGVPIAVATDCNPGTAPCTSILIALAMACTLFGLRPEEALQGATVNAARALGLAGDRGTLEVGKRADFALWEIDRPAELCYGLGANPCVGVVYGGRERAAV
ncbi:MAG: imidazolonepropionase [Steroidobacteraceae bacterium]|nr:imidazolonepropionase [Steroidobacteraceae bacterium]